MKLSISLTDEDLALVDAYVSKAGLTSRSAAIQQAIRLLRHATLDADYANAWNEHDATGEATAWDAVTPDGLVDATR